MSEFNDDHAWGCACEHCNAAWAGKPKPFKPPRVTGRPTFKELLGPERYAEMKRQARLSLLSREFVWSRDDFEFWKANTDLPIVNKWVRDDVPSHVPGTEPDSPGAPKPESPQE